MACRRFLCAVCAPHGDLLCDACRQSGSGATHGIREAHEALALLDEVERDLLALADAHDRHSANGVSALVGSGTAGTAQRLEELEIKQRTAEAAIEQVLRAPQLRDSRRASVIRTEVIATFELIQLAAARMRQSKVGGTAPWTAMLPRRRPGRRAWRNVLVAAALWTMAGAVVVAALNLWSAGTSVPPSVITATAPRVAATPSTAAREAVAGANPAAAPREAWSFDELEMGSSLPGGFLLRADDGAFAVAAFPNEIDRSLRLRATEAPGALCHRLSGVPSNLAVRVWLGGVPLDGSQLVDVVSADGSRLIAGVLTDAGRLELQGARQAVVIGRPNAGQWYVLRLRLNPSDGKASLVLNEGGTDLGRGAIQLEYPISAQRVCFGLPPGEPATELYIDDLRITY